MISPRKLLHLPRRQRLRKIAKMFGEAEARFCASGVWDYPLADITVALDVLALDDEFPPETAPSFAAAVAEARAACRIAVALPFPSDADAAENSASCENTVRNMRRGINGVRHILLAETGQSQADWDFLDADSRLDAKKRRVFTGMQVYLEDIRSPFNVGALFRAAESFGVERVLLSPLAADPLHQRAQRTAMGCVDIVPWERLALERIDVALHETPVFALETGGVDLRDFPFPARGVMIVGSEELGVSPASLVLADASLGRVSISTYGAKGSLNVAAAFAIVIREWAERLAVR